MALETSAEVKILIAMQKLPILPYANYQHIPGVHVDLFWNGSE